MKTKHLWFYECVEGFPNSSGKMVGDTSEWPWTFPGWYWTLLVPYCIQTLLLSLLFPPCPFILWSSQIPNFALILKQNICLEDSRARWWFPFLSGVSCAELFKGVMLPGVGDAEDSCHCSFAVLRHGPYYVARLAWKSQCSPGRTAHLQSCCLSAETTDATSCTAFLSKAFQLYRNSI